MRSASSRFCSCSTTTTTTPTSALLLLRGGGERKKGKRSPNETRFGRRRRLQRRRSSTTGSSAEGGGSEEARTMKNDDDIDRSENATMMGTTRTESTTNGTYIANSKVPKKLEPPKRDTGIPSELDINIDIDEGKKKTSHKKNENALASRKSNRWNVLMTFYLSLSLFFISLWFVSLSLSLSVCSI